MKQGVNDRGAKKWTKLMMPEFKENLQQIYNLPNNAKSVEEATKMKELILFVTGKKVRVAINYNPEGTVYEICGYIVKWNSQPKTVSLIDDYGSIKDLNFFYMESIEIIYP